MNECPICRNRTRGASSLGYLYVCDFCYAHYATPRTAAQVRETLVKMDQELESDSRLVEAKKHCEKLQKQVDELQRELAAAQIRRVTSA